MFDSPPVMQGWVLETVDDPESSYGTKRIAKPISIYTSHIDNCLPREEEDDGDVPPF
jgi:hypothetical protein